MTLASCWRGAGVLLGYPRGQPGVTPRVPLAPWPEGRNPFTTLLGSRGVGFFYPLPRGVRIGYTLWLGRSRSDYSLLAKGNMARFEPGALG